MNMTNRLCTTMLGMAMLMTCVEGAPAQDAAPPLRVLRWSELKEQGMLQAGEILAQDGPHAGVLKIEHTDPGPAVILLAEITDPGITALQYALSGQVRYENVTGTGFLEMLNYLPDGRWFYSRTQAQVGPMQSFSGTATWRDVQVPAYLGPDNDTPRPDRLVLNLYLAGPGTVYLSDLQLAHLSDEWAATAFGTGSSAGDESAWWSTRTGALIGAIVGSLLGMIGAAVGSLCAIGRGRMLVVALLVTMAVAGVVCLVAGLVAVIMGQPYAVYYPLLLVGVIASVLGCVGIPVSRQRFAQAELRRMQALDVA
jgi:hypothetical protein